MGRVNWEIVKGCEVLTHGCDSCPSFWHYKKHGLDYSVKTQMQNLDVPLNDLSSNLYMVAHGSDLFHESVKVDELERVFKVMNEATHHIFEITTKRIERASCVAKYLDWSDNIHLGVAVESGRYRWRLDYLRDIPAKYRFVSACPMLGPFTNVNLSGIDYVGMVKETWGFKRPMKAEWAEDLKIQCEEQGVSHTLNESHVWEAS